MAFTVGQKILASQLNDFNPSGDVNPGDDVALTSGGVVTWAGDTNLYRASASVLQTDDTFKAAGLQSTGAVAVSDTQNASGTTTSGTFTATLTGGTACGVVFTAPPSGMVLVHNVSEISNSGASFSYVGFQVRTGNSIGAGTIFLAVSVDDSLTANTTDIRRASSATLVTGLTAGSQYNAQQLFARDAGTLTAARKRLIVVPML